MFNSQVVANLFALPVNPVACIVRWMKRTIFAATLRTN